jgi:hypothetical protein
MEAPESHTLGVKNSRTRRDFLFPAISGDSFLSEIKQEKDGLEFSAQRPSPAIINRMDNLLLDYVKHEPNVA